jgi:hypothetical protein
MKRTSGVRRRTSGVRLRISDIDLERRDSGSLESRVIAGVVEERPF